MTYAAPQASCRSFFRAFALQSLVSLCVLALCISNLLSIQLGSLPACSRSVRRAEISRGCGNRPAADDGEAADERLDWECPACTLINAPASPCCDACGGPRPAATPASATGVSGGGGGSSGCCGAGAEGATGRVSGRDKRPAPATGAAAAARASRAAGVRKTAGARAVSGRALGASGDGGGGANAGLSGLRTWTCHECPFKFPNAEERRTCETCGALRDAAGKAAGNSGGGSTSTSRNSAGAVADRGWEQELPSWTCGRCTVVNSGMFLLCGMCEAERPVEGGRGQEPATGGGTGGRVAAAGWTTAQGGGSGDFSSARGVGAPVAGTPAPKGAAAAKVCRFCTLRNTSEAFECVACGIPFAEGEAAAAAAAVTGGGCSGGGDGRGGVVAMEEGVGGDPPGTAAASAVAAAASSVPECIDLS